MMLGTLGWWQAALGGGGGAPANWPPVADGIVADYAVQFSKNRSIINGVESTAAAAVNCTRALAAYYTDRAGLLTLVATNTLRNGDMGALIELVKTNVVLHNRDLTNAAWVKVACTAAKDQTGPDGVANSASSLTASAGNATCLQAIVLASSARFQTAYIKRVTGTGVINMTMDAGVTWTVVDVTSAWTRVEIPTQTLANPTVGFRIVTSGDAIAVDFAQNEDSAACATSPIPTTTVAVTRPADVISPTNTSYLNTTGMTVVVHGSMARSSASENGTFVALDNLSDSIFSRKSDTATANFGQNSGTQWNDIRAYPPGAANMSKLAAVQAIAPNNVGFCDSSGVVTTDTVATVATVTNVRIGAQYGFGPIIGQWDGYIQYIAFWDSRISDAALPLLARSLADFIVLSDGDSIPITPTTPQSIGFVGHASHISSQDWWFDNRAVGGSTVVNGSDAASLSGTRLTALNAILASFKLANPGVRNVTVVHVGHNDLAANGHNAGAFTAQLATYLDTLKTNGHTTVVCTVPPSTSNVAFNPARNTANTTIRTWLGGRVDYLCDWDLTSMGPDAAAADTTLYSDGIHPTALGARIFGDYLKTVLDTIAA